MSAERVMRWTCDKCGVTAIKEGYKMPAGWQLIEKPRVENRCPNCHKLPEKKP